ncbi:glycoside hydrolase family 16 protein [Nonomuraea sp. NPDC048826]|uniref:glycoside hydrolase family 16 protein n=1 Tax=Nonomuraea sp. NPDC048826 TaxID=3364347 RepID=UPI0037240D34
MLRYGLLVAAAISLTWYLHTKADSGGKATGSTGVLFDDFSYSGASDPLLAQRGWTARSGLGGPGVPGVSWSPSAVSFPDGLLTLDSVTDGTASGTVQAALFTTRQRFREGTYASRVRFSDTSLSGPDGGQVVQAFFTISPLRADCDLDYSELDFEYLPNGGWGALDTRLYATSWETYRTHPWHAVNTHTAEPMGFAGWHDLVIQVSGGRMRYYVDGRLFADHGGIYYPEQLMRIQFNQWFTALADGSSPQIYRLQVDWIYHSRGETVSPADVRARVAGFRAAGTDFRDTIGSPSKPAGLAMVTSMLPNGCTDRP